MVIKLILFLLLSLCFFDTPYNNAQCISKKPVFKPLATFILFKKFILLFVLPLILPIILPCFQALFNPDFTRSLRTRLSSCASSV